MQAPFNFPAVRAFVSCRQNTLGLRADSAWFKLFNFDEAPFIFTLSSLNLFWILFLPLRPRLIILLLLIVLFSWPPASCPDLKKEGSFVHSSGGRARQSRPRECWSWVLQAAEVRQAAELLQAAEEGHGWTCTLTCSCSFDQTGSWAFCAYIHIERLFSCNCCAKSICMWHTSSQF